jgi:hypothetical protein
MGDGMGDVVSELIYYLAKVFERNVAPHKKSGDFVREPYVFFGAALAGRGLSMIFLHFQHSSGTFPARRILARG